VRWIITVPASGQFSASKLRVHVALLFAILAAFFSPRVHAQDQGSDTLALKPKDSFEDSRKPKVFLRHLAEDQVRLWTSPLRLRPADAEWMIPVGGITTGLIMTDRTTEFQVSRGNHVNVSDNIANVGLGAYGGVVAGLYFFGHRSGDLRKQETGLLAGEAGINALAISTALKYVFERNRPLEGDGKGHFFRPISGSFYSTHATIAWSFASVISSEYPGWLSRTMAFGGATAISLSRVTGQKHWPSDVFVGAVAGYLVGKNVYRVRHDPDIDINSYGTFEKAHPDWNSGNAGTTYIPLDNWVYPVLQRLMAAGLVRYGYQGLRPYTRTAAADMIAEAETRIAATGEVSSELQLDVDRLQREFATELNLGRSTDNRAIRLETLYDRFMHISGQPLADSYHFGQTVINDFGRPYQAGFNNVTGFTARAETGRFSFFVRGEYQHAPGAPAYPLSARQAIAQADDNPVQPATPFAEVNAFRLLDTYASMTIAGHNISIGKQGLWWGPDDGGAMIFSANAEPIYMAQINRTIPLKIPGLSRLIGPVRYDFFFGKLSGHQYPPNPYMHGEKISFKPTENLEFGFSRTAVFAGQGLTPLTFHTFWRSLTSTTSSTGPGASLRDSPGVRHGQFDFSYRVPGIRNWLTIYSDSLVHDDISPIDAPRRAAIEPGFYLSHFPILHKLDLRVEAANTDPRITSSQNGRFFYWEGHYHDVYLNKQSLVGSWIGRESKGFQAWSTYWISPVSKVQFQYRNQKVAKDFIPQGETFNSYAIAGTIRIKPELEVQGLLQYDRWKAPVLAAGLQSNVTTSVQFTFWPKSWKVSSYPRK
jgi:membrane-associated phospholipid phosphatase